MDYHYDRRHLARTFSSPEALKEYLREHPNADPRKHKVVKEEGGSSGPSQVRVKPDKGVSNAIQKALGDEKGVAQQLRTFIDKGKSPSLNHVTRAIDEIDSKMKSDDIAPEKKKALGDLKKVLKDYAKV